MKVLMPTFLSKVETEVEREKVNPTCIISDT